MAKQLNGADLVMTFYQLALKWLAYAAILLTLFSVLTAVFVYYELHFGSCQSGGAGCETYLATLYAAGIGVVGFSLSALAALMIKRSFDRSGD